MLISDWMSGLCSSDLDYPRFLTDRARFGGLITDNPPLALVERYFNRSAFSNPLGLAATDIVAIIDGRIRNIATERQRGIDFDIGFAPELAGGKPDSTAERRVGHGWYSGCSCLV